MNPQQLVERFQHPTVRAFALFGSHARGDADADSDVDLIRFIDSEEANPPGSGSHLIDNQLIVVSNYGPETVEAWFTEPTAAVQAIAGLRQAQPLSDPESYFATLQERAKTFEWTDELQAKASRWASEQMVGWIEEVHKGLGGLRRNDTGRLLNAAFGLSWGLAGVVKVQRGVLVYSDNSFLAQLFEEIGPESRWSQLCATSFGLAPNSAVPPSLQQRVTAGLQLYIETALLLQATLQLTDRPAINHTVKRIQDQLVRCAE